jgi:methionyl-tRNA synthetase
LRAELPSAIDGALGAFDLRRATSALWEAVSEANRFVSVAQPWKLANAARTGDAGAAAEVEAVLGVLLETCSFIGDELRPFLPLAAERIGVALADLDPQRGRALFPKVA